MSRDWNSEFSQAMANLDARRPEAKWENYKSVKKTEETQERSIKLLILTNFLGLFTVLELAVIFAQS